MRCRPLVLLHGWGMRPEVWRALTTEITTGYNIIALPLPGHDGAVPAPSPTLEAWTDTVKDGIPDGAIVVGWSLGAMLALDLAVRYPHKVSRLALIGATPRFVCGSDWQSGLPQDTVSAFRLGYAQSPRQTLRRFQALQTLGDSARRSLLPKLEACGELGDSENSALTDGLTVLAQTDLRAAVSTIQQPVQLIHGEGDALMPVDAAHYLCGAIPHARLDILEGCGHAPHLSRTVQCAALIREFADA